MPPITWRDSLPEGERRLIDFFKIEIPGPVPMNVIVMVEAATDHNEDARGTRDCLRSAVGEGLKAGKDGERGEANNKQILDYFDPLIAAYSKPHM